MYPRRLPNFGQRLSLSNVTLHSGGSNDPVKRVESLPVEECLDAGLIVGISCLSRMALLPIKMAIGSALGFGPGEQANPVKVTQHGSAKLPTIAGVAFGGVMGANLAELRSHFPSILDARPSGYLPMVFRFAVCHGPIFSRSVTPASTFARSQPFSGARDRVGPIVAPEQADKIIAVASGGFPTLTPIPLSTQAVASPTRRYIQVVDNGVKVVYRLVVALISYANPVEHGYTQNT